MNKNWKVVDSDLLGIVALVAILTNTLVEKVPKSLRNKRQMKGTQPALRCKIFRIHNY